MVRLYGEMSALLCRDSKGKPLYLMTSIVNITERKRAEEKLRESEIKFRNV